MEGQQSRASASARELTGVLTRLSRRSSRLRCNLQTCLEVRRLWHKLEPIQGRRPFAKYWQRRCCANRLCNLAPVLARPDTLRWDVPSRNPSLTEWWGELLAALGDAAQPCLGPRDLTGICPRSNPLRLTKTWAIPDPRRRCLMGTGRLTLWSRKCFPRFVT